MAIVAPSSTSSRGGVTLVRFYFLLAEVAFALAAEFSEAACGWGRTWGGVWGSAVSIGGPAIGGCQKHACSS